MSLSVLRRPSTLISICPLRSSIIKSAVIVPKRWDSHKVMKIVPTDFAWHKLKDMWHFYGCISLIFFGGIALYANIFIGPATLAEIPEGYRPKHWEYYRHPIARWLQRYCYGDPQMNYEKFLAYLYEEQLFYDLNLLDKRVQDRIKERKDYEAYYVRPVTADYHKYFKEMQEVSERYSSTIDDDV